MSNDNNEMRYRVVVNHEEQYSFWPEDRELPKGWKAEGFVGKKDDCLTHIEAVWPGMKPVNLRKKM